MERVLRSCNKIFSPEPTWFIHCENQEKIKEKRKNSNFLAVTITHLPWRSCSTYAAEFSVAEKVKIIVKGRTFNSSSTFAPNCDYHSTQWISWFAFFIPWFYVDKNWAWNQLTRFNLIASHFFENSNVNLKRHLKHFELATRGAGDYYIFTVL